MGIYSLLKPLSDSFDVPEGGGFEELAKKRDVRGPFEGRVVFSVQAMLTGYSEKDR